jgi:two-component system nitrogen regulation response regulator GlnG
VLTIGVHPDLRRVGDRAILVGLGPEGAVVSRAEPSFLDAHGRTTGPLHDRHVSRAPLRIVPDGRAVHVDASAVRNGVEIDGETVLGVRRLAPQELDRGVVLVLSGTVLLVLRSGATVRSPASHGLAGASDEITAVRRALELAAGHADPVLLLGETGTGKELVASALHAASPRASRPFVAVNVSTLTPSTAAAELFGHSRGAFTGADGAHEGYFGRADGGTLFLDEIGDLPPLVQPMLLRALESGEITPVGGRTTRRVDVRVVAATDRDLASAAAAGSFRLPLLHRLSGHVIALPPLSVRKEDLLPLFVRFLLEERPDADAACLPMELARQLLARPWPGNVRELRNAARAVARGGTAAIPTFEPERQAARATAPGGASARDLSEDAGARDLSDEAIVAALRRHAFRIGATAEALGIARNTLYKRMERCEGLRRARDLDAPEIRAACAIAPHDLESVAARLEVSARGLRLRMRELGIDPPSE